MESLVRTAILQHMILNGTLSDYQLGCVNGRSYTTNLFKVMDKWSEVLDPGGAVDAVYLDYAKTFNTVPRERLLCKLRSYGIEGQLLRWIRNLVTRQWVGVAGTFSTRTKTLSGVPQGSVQSYSSVS